MAMPRLGWVWRLNARQNHLNGSFGWLAGSGSLALVGTEKVSKHFNRSAGLQTQTETIPPGSTPADQCPRGKSPPQAVQKSFSLEVPLYRQAEAIWRDGSWSHLHMWSLRGVGQRTTRAVHFFCIFRPHRGYYLERLRDGCLCCSTLPTGVAVAWGMRRVCRCAGLPWFVFCC